MRNVIISTLFLFYLVNAEKALAEAVTKESIKAKFPFVVEVKGTVENAKKTSKPVRVARKDILTENALLKTTDKASLRLELDGYTTLSLFENSELELPVISWGEGEVSELRLKRGKIRVDCQMNCKREFVTALSRNAFTNGEFILEYRPESPDVALTVLHGQQEFRGLENEESLSLAAGQRVVFQGLKENEEVAYDILLKGRKVARGKLQPIVVLTATELAELDKKTILEKPVVIKKKIVRLAGQICSEPFASLNQCVWRCQGLSKKMKSCDLNQAGVTCLRQRCNANGAWGDTQLMAKAQSRCELEPVVKSCDY